MKTFVRFLFCAYFIFNQNENTLSIPQDILLRKLQYRDIPNALEMIRQQFHIRIYKNLLFPQFAENFSSEKMYNKIQTIFKKK